MGTVHAKSIRQEDVTKIRDDDAEGKFNVNLEKVPARVDFIHIDGLQRTKDDIVTDAVKDVFNATNFQDVILRVHKVRGRLEALGCFKNVGVFIDTSKGEKATKDGLEITFHVNELKRVVGGINTMIGNNEGSVVLSTRFPNLFGRGEKIQMEYSYGSKKSNNFNVQFMKPIRGPAFGIITSSIYQQRSEWPWSGFQQTDRGFILDFGFNSTPLVKHNLQWDACIRDLSVLSRTTSFAIREQSGLSLKSSVKHILSLDQRDETVFPTSGALFQITSELAGFGGDVGFLKNELLVQANYSLLDGIVMQGAVQGGFLKSISPDKKILMCDQFYLGGPQTIRGFQMRGIGPHSDGNALGSDIFLAGAVHLYTPLPFLPGRGGFSDLFRMHYFVNAGNVGTVKLDNIEATVSQLLENVRIAYGLGLAVRLGQTARIELNYCFPYYFQRSDLINPGVQFGIGIQFL